MDNGYCFMHIGALVMAGPLMWLWGREMLSCYFPFLLSAKHYYVVKNPLLRRMVISDRLNRSQNSKTRLEDRNKLPLIGCFYYIVGAVLLGAFYVSGICAVVRDISGSDAAVIHFLAALCPYLILAVFLLIISTFIFYQIDYGIGKLCGPGSGRL